MAGPAWLRSQGHRISNSRPNFPRVHSCCLPEKGCLSTPPKKTSASSTQSILEASFPPCSADENLGPSRSGRGALGRWRESSTPRSPEPPIPESQASPRPQLVTPDTGTWRLRQTLLDWWLPEPGMGYEVGGARNRAPSLRGPRNQGCLERGHKRLVSAPKRLCLLDLESSARRCCSS